MERKESSIDALLDEIENVSGRHEDQRSSSAPGCDVYLNIYDMVFERETV